MKKLCTILLCTFILVGLIGCGSEIEKEEKKVLYKIDVENIPYLGREDFLMLYRFYDMYGNEITLSMDDYGYSECSYYYTEKYTNLLIQKNFKSCRYSVENNKITLELTVLNLTVTNPNEVYASSTSTEEDLIITGMFDETGKQLVLTIDGKEYKLLNEDYRDAKDEYYLTYALYDAETGEIYDLKGKSIRKYGENYERIELDLSEYEIKEELIPHEPFNKN